MGAEVRALIRPAGTFSRKREKGATGEGSNRRREQTEKGANGEGSKPENGANRRTATCTAFSRVREKVAQSAG
jgi:hypothetical protein